MRNRDWAIEYFAKTEADWWSDDLPPEKWLERWDRSALEPYLCDVCEDGIFARSARDGKKYIKICWNCMNDSDFTLEQVGPIYCSALQIHKSPWFDGQGCCRTATKENRFCIPHQFVFDYGNGATFQESQENT